MTYALLARHKDTAQVSQTNHRRIQAVDRAMIRLRSTRRRSNLVLRHTTAIRRRITVERQTNFKTPPMKLVCGPVAEWLGRWTCDQWVAGSNPGLPAVECNPGQVVNTHVPLSAV